MGRRLFVVSDMIISGEKEGPLKPFPISVGMIGAGYNFAMFDMLCATLMGFDVNKIPSLKEATVVTEYPLIDSSDELVVKSNNEAWNNKKINEIDKETTFRYRPSKGWREKIEL